MGGGVRRGRVVVPLGITSGVFSVLLAVAVNVATGGTLPGSLRPVAWLAWPAVGLLGALLFVVPGFVTDLLGLALLLPPLRRGARVVVRRSIERRFSSAVAGDLFGPRQVRVRVRRTTPEDGEPIEGEIVDS